MQSATLVTVQVPYSMRTLIKLFGRSPFALLKEHMDKVAACVQRVPDLFLALRRHDYPALSRIAEEISLLEHQADLAKNDIRNGLKSHLFLPVDRGSLLEILGIQDSLADKAEDIGVLLTTRELKSFEGWDGLINQFLEKNLQAFNGIHEVVSELHEILESSFGGVEAEKIRAMVDDIARCEHEADVIQRDLLRLVFSSEDLLSYASFYLWMRVIEEVGALSNLSEKLGNRILMTMELK